MCVYVCVCVRACVCVCVCVRVCVCVGWGVDGGGGGSVPDEEGRNPGIEISIHYAEDSDDLDDVVVETRSYSRQKITIQYTICDNVSEPVADRGCAHAC